MRFLKKYWASLLFSLLLITSLVFISFKLFPKRLPPYLLMGEGNIDGNLINLNTEYPGRVLKIFADEGDNVKKGQILAILDSREYKEELKAVEFQINSSKGELNALKQQLEIAKVSLPAEVKKAKDYLESLKNELNTLDRKIEAQTEVVKEKKRVFQRVDKLRKKNFIPQEKWEFARLDYITAKKQLQILEEKRKELLKKVEIAKENLKEAKANLKRIEKLKDKISALRNRIKSLEHEREKIRVIISKLTLVSPVDGYVVDKIAHKGEVLGAGYTVLTLIDPEELYLKIFLSTLSVGKVKVGDKAEIFLDAYPDRPIPARVIRISPKAEFTPKEVAVREARIERVYDTIIHKITKGANSIIRC
jgi:HlyD family secretion protein